MSLILPLATDAQNSPDHSFLHRVVAVDDTACECTIMVMPSGIVCVRDVVQLGNPGGTCGILALAHSGGTYCTCIVSGSLSSSICLIMPPTQGDASSILYHAGSGQLCWRCYGCACAACYGGMSICGVCCVSSCCGYFVCCVDFGGQTATCATAVCDASAMCTNFMCDAGYLYVLCGA